MINFGKINKIYFLTPVLKVALTKFCQEIFCTPLCVLRIFLNFFILCNNKNFFCNLELIREGRDIKDFVLKVSSQKILARTIHGAQNIGACSMYGHIFVNEPICLYRFPSSCSIVHYKLLYEL